MELKALPAPRVVPGDSHRPESGLALDLSHLKLLSRN